MKNPNLRIVWDNAADRGTLVASSEAGSLVVGNLRTNIKSDVWRGLSNEESFAIKWDEPEPIDVVVLAFNNFTADATVRIKGFAHDSDLLPNFDTDDVVCAPPPGLGQFQWGTPLGENFYQRGGASMFAYGHGGYGTVWIPGAHAVRKLEITINDEANPDGYLEVGRLITGPYWTPLHNFDFGHGLIPVDSTKNTRTEAGDLRGERGARWRRAEFTLSNMHADDRAAVLRLLRRRGTSEPVFISMFPENDDPMLEQSYQIWGKFADSARITQPRYDLYASSLAVEEM